MIDLVAEAAALRDARRPYVHATVVWRRAPTSGQIGAKAVVLADGTVRGFIGGACAEPTLVRQALEALRDGQPRLLFLGPSDEFDGVLRDDVVRVPMACESEGALEIYLEPVVPCPRVVVVGRSPLAETLGALGADVGWSAEVVDDLEALTALRPDAGTAVVAELVSVHAAGGLRDGAGSAADRVVNLTEATDPVCGMTVSVADARQVSEWNGGLVYFCAASCKHAFDAEPDKYAAALA